MFLATKLCTGGNSCCCGQHGLGITSWNEGHSWSLASRVAIMGHQPSCKAQRYVRSGHKTLSYAGRQLDNLPGQSQVNGNFGHSTPFSILFQSIQAGIYKYEFHKNFILMLFSLCKVIPSILTSCLTSSFFSEMPSCENVEKNKSCPLPPYAVSSEARSSSNLALRRHSFYGATMSWLLRDSNKLKESERALKIF